ncbi:FAD-dependent monooxygenase [Streptomyces justiciae]|uniref:FAD-dependent monooxygenase n=1 Tax=Streptomyces justiciae TaxID=2780140 RepID=UPI002117723C|nr:FAD-dependent monooxygenase [Streptomyces justiciae]MCW8379695.1 FAD-dependent monooxygenase [Streptomyces justiciae]
MSRRVRVAVVGGGIGGMAAAAFLRRAGVSAEVFEQARELREAGAGLVLAPNAARLVRRLDTAVALEDVGVALQRGSEFRRWADGTELFSLELGEVSRRRYGEDTWTLHRSDLLKVLRSALPADRVHLGRRCVGFVQDPTGAVVEFEDGSTVRADVVIAADGVHSVLREHAALPTEPRASGVCAWRALVAADAAPEPARRPVQTVWLGPGRHLVHYPVSSGRLVNIVAFSPVRAGDVESWSVEGRVEDFAAEFAGWDPRLKALITAAEQVGRWSVLDRAPLSAMVRGRLVLLGDAAHPMLPFFAQGAGQAIEDAAVLAACMAGRGADVDGALAVYERLRLPRATLVQGASRSRLAVNHLPDGPQQRARDRAFAEGDPLKPVDWLFSYDAEQVAAVSLARPE